jgi:Uma2 family endonuclease
MKTVSRKKRPALKSQNGAFGRHGTRVFVNDIEVHVPGWVLDINSFRRWTDNEDFPLKGYIWWLRGEVWADMSKEQIFSHLAVKQEFFRVLGNLAKTECPGMLIPDGLLLSNFVADISGNPDATYIANATLDSDRVRLVEGAGRGYVEVQGSPDMVLEVVSDSSEKKDLVLLMEDYWKARIPEYWLVDSREEPTRFDIWKPAQRGYRKTIARNGWLASSVFGKSFRLNVQEDRLKRKSYTLEVR